MKKRIYVFSLLSLLFIIFMWFLVFDISYFWDECEDCLYVADIVQYRLFTVPIYMDKYEYHSPRERIAEDLNVSCLHTNLSHTHYVRRWGGLIGIQLSDNMPYTLVHTLSYEPNILKELIIIEPNLPEEFFQKVIIEHDQIYFNNFIERLSKFKDN